MLWSKLAASYNSVTLGSHPGLSDKPCCEAGSGVGVEILGCDVKASYSSTPGLAQPWVLWWLFEPLVKANRSLISGAGGTWQFFTPFSVSHLLQSRWVWAGGRMRTGRVLAVSAAALAAV